MCFVFSDLSLLSVCVFVGMKEEELSWSSYIKVNKIQTAPKALFQNQNMVS